MVVEGERRDRAALGLAVDLDEVDAWERSEQPAQRAGIDPGCAVLQAPELAADEAALVEQLLDHRWHQQRVRRAPPDHLGPRVDREARERAERRAGTQRHEQHPEPGDVVERRGRGVDRAGAEPEQTGVDVGCGAQAVPGVRDRLSAAPTCRTCAGSPPVRAGRPSYDSGCRDGWNVGCTSTRMPSGSAAARARSRPRRARRPRTDGESGEQRGAQLGRREPWPERCERPVGRCAGDRERERLDGRRHRARPPAGPVAAPTESSQSAAPAARRVSSRDVIRRSGFADDGRASRRQHAARTAPARSRPRSSEEITAGDCRGGAVAARTP